MNRIQTALFIAFLALQAGCATNSGTADKSSSDSPSVGTPDIPDRRYPPAQYPHLDWDDLIVMLPDWEVSLPCRGGYLSEVYPNGIPDKIVKIPGQGAQCGIDVFRLDRSIVGVITHVEEVEDWHELKILRRVENGWDDLTSELFDGQTRWGKKPQLGDDFSITVFGGTGVQPTKHQWIDGRYRTRSE